MCASTVRCPLADVSPRAGVLCDERAAAYAAAQRRHSSKVVGTTSTWG